MPDVELHTAYIVEKVLMRLRCLWPQNTHCFILIMSTPVHPTSPLMYCRYQSKEMPQRCLFNNRSCPTKPWSFQIQYFFTDLEPQVGQLNSLRCLIHAMKSMFRPISIYVISLASVGSPQQWAPLSAGAAAHLSASLVNQRRRLINVTEQQGCSWLRWVVGTKEDGIKWLTARWAITRPRWGSIDIFWLIWRQENE